MDVKKIVMLVGALVIAGISAFFVRTLISDSSTPQVQAAVAEDTGPKVLVATTALPIGTILNAESFKYQPWPKDLVENAYFLEGETDAASLAGKVVRVSIPAGQPVTKGAIVGPGERGFLAAALTPGMRAVTVSINAESGVAGFIFPGDRVDMVLTQGIGFAGDTEQGTPASTLKVAETILRNVRILAIDQRTNDLGGEEQGPKTGRTVTFEVPPKFVEKIAVAQSLGQISLSLRPLADSTQELEQAIATGEVDVADNQDATADKSMTLAFKAHPSDRNPSFTTGGEVSRFASNLDPRPAAVRNNKPEGPTVRVFRGGKSAEVSVGAN
jgi:pilus assembly protein CpaB